MNLKGQFLVGKHEINISKIVDINEVKEKFNISSFEIVDFSTGYDECIYLLFLENVPNRIDDMFVDTKYTVVCIEYDWKNTTVYDMKCYHLGILEYDYHYLRPYKKDLLLIGARCERFSDDEIENNALLISRKGNMIKEFCLGDGIQDCITTWDNQIIISYFDEGIFGNYGWDKPLGRSGLISWNEFGKINWENSKYGISDCYAMNIDSLNRLWFYYYTNFDLVCTDYKSDFILDPQIEGSHAFAISDTGKQIIMAGGYNDENFYIHDFNEDQTKMSKCKSVIFTSNQCKVDIVDYKFCSSKLLLLTENNILCGYYFN